MSKQRTRSLTRLANAAMRKAAASVIQIAKQTGTPVIVWEDGGIKAIPADIMEARLQRLFKKKKKH
jgi:hypothetical protein